MIKIVLIVITFKPDHVTVGRLVTTLGNTNVEIIENVEGKNLGYAGGANEGIRKALAKGAEWVVIVNQDIKITKEAVSEFTKMLETTDPSVAGPFVGKLDPKRWTTILEKEDERLLRRQNGLAMTNESIDYISGSFMAIHKKVIEKIGLFYEPYFMYYEDADLSVRAVKAGFPLTQIKIRDIEHEESTSLGRGTAAHEYYLSRNHLLFVERNAPIAVKLREIIRMPKTLWEHYEKMNKGALLGIRDYALRRFGEYKN